MKKFLNSLFAQNNLLEADDLGSLMDDENVNGESEIEETHKPSDPPPSFVKVPAEEFQELQNLYNQMSEIQMLMGQVLVEFESKKDTLLKKLEEAKAGVQSSVDVMRKKHGIPEDAEGYTLSLPKKGQEFGAFIREGVKEVVKEDPHAAPKQIEPKDVGDGQN